MRQELYPGNVLSSFENGVQMDLRVKLAVEFLKFPHLAGGADASPQLQAENSLEVADALLTAAAERGWLQPLPEDGQLNAPFRRHIERSTRAGILQQLAGQRIAEEEAPSVAVARGLNGAPLRQ